MRGKAVRNWRGNGKAVTKIISCGNGKQPPLNVNCNYVCKVLRDASFANGFAGREALAGLGAGGCGRSTNYDPLNIFGGLHF